VYIKDGKRCLFDFLLHDLATAETSNADCELVGCQCSIRRYWFAIVCLGQGNNNVFVLPTTESRLSFVLFRDKVPLGLAHAAQKFVRVKDFSAMRLDVLTGSLNESNEKQK
jgi:hypothetical protein